MGFDSSCQHHIHPPAFRRWCHPHRSNANLWGFLITPKDFTLADNVNPPLNGAIPVATDDVGGVHFQKVKLDLGADGVSTPVVNSVPVSPAAAYSGDNGSGFTVSSVKKAFRKEFPGGALDTNVWDLVQTGSGHAVTVGSNVLQIATGTTSTTETIIRSVESFAVPAKLFVAMQLSQRIANQEFYVELVSEDGTSWAQWKFDGTTATNAKYNNRSDSFSKDGLSAASTTTTTASPNWYMIEIQPDAVTFSNRILNSGAANSGFFIRNRSVPDPSLLYKIQFRALNLTAPASTTNFIIESVTLLDFNELRAEVTSAGGDGQVSTAMPVSVVSQPILLRLNNALASANDTTTTLGSSATYTGAAKDATASFVYSKFRVQLAHTAGLTTGHLVIESSIDNTTYREQARVPIPSDGQYRTFSFPVVTRYIRAKFINGATAQTAFELKSALIVSDGANDMSGNNILVYPESITNLSASATFTGDTLDVGANSMGFSEYGAFVVASHSGTLRLQQSPDATNWHTTSFTYVGANSPSVLYEDVALRYVRVQYVNDAVAQTSFLLQSSLKS